MIRPVQMLMMIVIGMAAVGSSKLYHPLRGDSYLNGENGEGSSVGNPTTHAVSPYCR